MQVQQVRDGSGVEVGARVEVRQRFTERWSRGFEVAAVDGDEVELRRCSDGAVLPARFPLADLRRA